MRHLGEPAPASTEQRAIEMTSIEMTSIEMTSIEMNSILKELVLLLMMLMMIIFCFHQIYISQGTSRTSMGQANTLRCTPSTLDDAVGALTTTAFIFPRGGEGSGGKG